MFCLHDVGHGVMSADVAQAKHWGGIMNMTAGLDGLISQLRQLQGFQKIATLQVSHSFIVAVVDPANDAADEACYTFITFRTLCWHHSCLLMFC